MKFTKMHGLGNDYVYINCFEEKPENLPELATKMSDRHFGIGGDGIVLIMPSDSADFKMRIFNADGSEAEMCGNATRCVGKYVYDNKMTDKTEVSLETLAGIKILHLTVENGEVTLVRVDMGEPVLEPAKIPVVFEKERFISEEIEVDSQKYKATCVSMGNPHAVVYMDEVKGLEIEKVGPKFEHHKLFPRRTNTEFVKVIDIDTLEMRVWERGAGETLACGTGACAVLVSSVLNGFSNRKATIKLLGGDLIIEWDEKTNHVFKTGPATKVFDGVWEEGEDIECFDVLDLEGNFTGEIKLRTEVHRDGDWHSSAHIWILNDNNELIIQKRSPIKDSNPNMWDISSAGHCKSGEGRFETAIKEIQEELGLDVTEKDLEYLFTVREKTVRNNGTFINNEFQDVYLFKCNLDLATLELQEEEVSEVKFVHYKELERLVNAKDESIVHHDEEYRRLFEILHERLG